MKKILALLVILGIGLWASQAYLFGLKSADDSIENIQTIQDQYLLDLPIVAFIFDPREHKAEAVLDNLVEELWKDKIYHISVSPHCSAKEVAEGCFDDIYRNFFERVKKMDIRVIFRTMHEMNWGRYPWGSDPDGFKDAWKHVWNLSREIWLDQKNILFDMSVNHWDMPAKGNPSQDAELIKCTPASRFYKKIIRTQIWTKMVEEDTVIDVQEVVEIPNGLFDTTTTIVNKKKVVKQLVEKPLYKIEEKETQYCYAWEDYYPGDKYVDIMGVTFYNRWKGNSSRLWLSPQEIMYDPIWKTLDRLKKVGKPIFIDEVWTTSVWYDGPYSFQKSQEVYKNDNWIRKEKWLYQLYQLLEKEEDIVGMVYFNIDVTFGLKRRIIWELDWSIINFDTNKIYDKWFYLYSKGEAIEGSKLDKLFNKQEVKIEKQVEESPFVEKIADKLMDKYDDKLVILDKLYKLSKIDDSKINWLVRSLIEHFLE